MIKMLFFPILLLGGTLFSVLPSWEIGNDYAVRFSTKKAEGTFSDLKGTVKFSPDDLTNARFDVSVAVTSIQTGNKSKDKHARGKSWFDAENHPRINFTSSSFTATDAGYQVTGDISIKGTTKSITIDFTFTPSAAGGLFTGSTSILRKDFGLDGPFLFGGLVGDEVTVDLKVPVN